MKHSVGAIFLAWLAPLATLLASAESRSEEKTAGGKPNILVIYADDLGYGDVHRPQLQRLHTALQSWHAATKDTDFEMPALPAAKPGDK
jgi:hypothetical protein